MAFERLEVRNPSGAKGAPAAMSLSCHGGSARPAALVALSKALCVEAGLSDKSKFDIFIGTDDDAGKLRIEAEKDGLVAPRALKGGGLLLNLGYVPVIGVEPCKKMPTEAAVIERGTVEVMIPDFEGDRPRMLPAPPADRAHHEKPAAAPAPAKGGATAPKPAKGAGKNVEHFNGITIDLTEDAETVSFREKSTEVTSRQAHLVKLLARPRPAPVASSFLIKELWGSSKPPQAEDALRNMCGDLQKALSPLGLALNVVKGVGYQLKDR
jgi:hypothetical protein